MMNRAEQNWSGEQVVTLADEQYNRTIAYVNMSDDVHANCEECGAQIPVELILCDDCREVSND